MHVRLSMCIGMPVLDERSDEALASVTGIFAHPDLGTLEGLFVMTARGEEFLAVSDIAHWGRSVVVRDPDAIAPLDERVRLMALWDEARPIVNQRIVTEGGMFLGRCKDVQFETDTFRMEWLFPRKMLRWQRPVPVTAVVEVTVDAVKVRDTYAPAQALPEEEAAMSALEAIGGGTTVG
jgi:sporulation protein YlmC with PRC-barrel domain